MKNPKKANGKGSAENQLLLARAAAAEKAVETARKQARQAKARLKQARKHLKKCKKLAKEARRLAKAAAKKAGTKPRSKARQKTARQLPTRPAKPVFRSSAPGVPPLAAA